MVGAFFGLILLSPLLIILFILAMSSSGRNGFFLQSRIGRNGKPFKVVKFRSMRDIAGLSTTVTTKNDPRITPIGRVLRRTKMDELPQLVNILIGQMSFVGPRPDVEGFADTLKGKEREILDVRPGVTGPATLRFRDEEEVLACQKDPEGYSRSIIWPEKVRLNLDYVRNYSFKGDIMLILRTLRLI